MFKQRRKIGTLPPLTNMVEGFVKYMLVDEPLEVNCFTRYEKVVTKVYKMYHGNSYILYFAHAIDNRWLQKHIPYLVDQDGRTIGRLKVEMIYEENKIYKFHKTLIEYDNIRSSQDS